MADNSIIVVCKKCQSKYRVPSNRGNIEVTCGKCGEKFVVWSGEKIISNAPKNNTDPRQVVKKQSFFANLTQKQKKVLRIAIVVFGIIIIGICADTLTNQNSTAYNINKGMSDYIDYADKAMKTKDAKDTMDTLNKLGLPYGDLHYDK